MASKPAPTRPQDGLGGVLVVGVAGYRRGYGGGAGGAGCRAPSEVRARKSPQSSLRGGGEVRVTAHAGEVTSLLPLPGGTSHQQRL